MNLVNLIIIGCLSVGTFFPIASSERNFQVDWENNQFLKDGEPFRYVSGSFHYSRTPSTQWEDRMMKMKAGGLNAVQTYIMWNFHTQTEGVYDFTGDRDIENFLQIANDTGLLVVMRAGPYSCAEWEFGGFPWFLRQDDIILRSSDPKYLSYVDAWLDVLLPKFERFLYNNGGPIITVQFENEYGSYPTCDKAYLQHLVQKFREHLGPDVVLFTTDGFYMSYLECGAVKSELVTVDFGTSTDPEEGFKDKQKFQPYGPLVNSEYYTGWLNQWGYSFTYISAEAIATTLDKILAMNASVNFYMYVGGTNFAYWSGANSGDDVNTYDITSYDYDSPISESGDTTWKYFVIKDTIAKYLPPPEIPVPKNSTKTALKGIKLASKGTLLIYFDYLANASDYQSAKYPKSMEELGFDYGFVLYRTHLTKDYPENIKLSFPLNGIGDRVTILTAMSHNHSTATYLGTLDNKYNEVQELQIDIGLQEGYYIVLISENRGRVNYGPDMQNQHKGIDGNVTLNGEILEDWDMIHLKLEGMGTTILPPPDVPPSEAPVPIVYQAEVEMDIEDTFLNCTSFSRGVAMVDTFNLGRYWNSLGPQQTLYVPKGIRTSTKFILTLVEFEERSVDEMVDFLDYPILNQLT